jgi:hypothetical protein
MAGDPRLTARPGHAACTASPETYRNSAQGSFRHAVNGSRFGPEHPNIPSREVGHFPCGPLRHSGPPHMLRLRIGCWLACLLQVFGD